jgi:hypothetical protein
MGNRQQFIKQKAKQLADALLHEDPPHHPPGPLDRDFDPVNRLVEEVVALNTQDFAQFLSMLSVHAGKGQGVSPEVIQHLEYAANAAATDPGDSEFEGEGDLGRLQF